MINDKPVDSTSLTKILIVVCAVCVFCALAAIIMFSHIKGSERAFGDKNAALVRERTELKIQFDSLSEDFDKNKFYTDNLEKEKKSIEDAFARVEKEYNELKGQNAKKLYLLKHENMVIRKKIEAFQKISAVELIKQIVSRESDRNIKNILSDTLAKMEAAKNGRYIPLDPIVLAAPTADKPETPYGSKQGKIVSVDKKNCLIVVNMGRAQEVEDGRRCRIVDDHGEIAAGTIIRARHKISAAFIDTFSPRRTIEDVKEDARVVID